MGFPLAESNDRMLMVKQKGGVVDQCPRQVLGCRESFRFHLLGAEFDIFSQTNQSFIVFDFLTDECDSLFSGRDSRIFRQWLFCHV